MEKEFKVGDHVRLYDGSWGTITEIYEENGVKYAEIKVSVYEDIQLDDLKDMQR